MEVHKDTRVAFKMGINPVRHCVDIRKNNADLAGVTVEVLQVVITVLGRVD